MCASITVIKNDNTDNAMRDNFMIVGNYGIGVEGVYGDFHFYLTRVQKMVTAVCTTSKNHFASTVLGP